MFIARRSYEVIIVAYFGQCDLEKQRGGPTRCGNTGNYLVPLHSASTVIRMQSILAKLDYMLHLSKKTSYCHNVSSSKVTQLREN